MKTLKINITKAEIFREAALLTAYAGLKGDPTVHPVAKVALADEDGELAERLWKETTGETAEKLQCFIEGSEIDRENFSLTLSLSNSYDDALTPSVVNDLTASIVNGVTARWFRYALPERAGEWNLQSSDLLDRAFRKLCHRKKPNRKTLT